MKAKQPLIFGLDEFGLSVAKLTSLASVEIKVHVYLRHIDEKSLFKFKPSERMEKMKLHYELLLARVRTNWVDGPLEINSTRRQPRGFSASIESRHVSRLLRMPEIGSIWLDKIPGRKRSTLRPKERWFAVQARFGIQVEGQTTGLQSYEDRIVIVRAINLEDAEKKVQPRFKQYATPYLNSRGFMVRWAYERILDVYEIIDEKIDTPGTEIFSVLARRRMKPEYRWSYRPKRESS